jgi:two-component system phosphate regulon response regulator PhoB
VSAGDSGARRDGLHAPQPVALIVEGNPHLAAMVTYYLENAGYLVESLGDGELGLERARQGPIDLVIAEVLLPRRDGLSLCRTLKGDPATRSVRVLIFSILAAEERALEAGADAFVRKPLDQKNLLDAVERVMSSRGGTGSRDGTRQNR